ncbi:MAG: metallophosphoesterase [Myxococcales bacterium]|nr:MAG: metallophosphoesterase [Myxococcales bacterium]
MAGAGSPRAARGAPGVRQDRARGAVIRRVGAIGDIHAEDERLARALEVLGGEAVDLIVATGDVVDGPGDVDRCCELLVAHGVQGVRGNHERWALRGPPRLSPGATDLATLTEASQRFLRWLPAERTFDTVAGRLLLCHGVGPHDMVQLRPDHHEGDLADNEAFQELARRRAWDVVIAGHTHEPMDRRLPGGVRWINAGSLCRDREPVVVVADLGTGEVRFIPV